MINNAVVQLRELFRSMTPGARVTAGLLLLAVIASLGFLFAGGSASSDEYLFGGVPLSAGEANKIQGALLSAGIEVDISGNRIRVPAGRKYEAMGAIVTADALPLNVHEIMLQTLDSGSVWEGSKMTKERKEAGLEHQLAMVLRTFPWVETAMVNFEEKKPRALQREDIVTAAVTIKPMPGESVSPLRKDVIQRLAAHWFAGLAPTDVEVIDLHNAGGGGGTGDTMDRIALVNDPYLKVKFQLEDAISRDIQHHLRDIEGIRVLVQAELNPELETMTVRQTPDPKGTAQRIETEEESTTSTTMGPGGRVGLEAQGPGAQLDATASTNQNKSTVTRDAYDNLVGITQETTQTAGLTPKDIKASIQIPMDWLVQTVWKRRWQRQNPAAAAADMPWPTQDELQRLQDEQKTQLQTQIENILPDRPAGEDPFPRVQVSFYESKPSELQLEPAFTESALSWVAQYWTTVGMFGLALISLLMLRSTVKSISVKSQSAAAERPTLELDLPVEKPREDDEAETDRPRLKLNKGPTLKDDLAQLVREDPDVAATILRSWISHAA